MPLNLTTVFLSSTWRDLAEHRAKIRDALLTAGFHPIAMETFAAGQRPALDTCLKQLDQADVYLAVIGHRYLVDIALTLHRLPEPHRSVGLDLFEKLLESGVQEAQAVADELDIRPKAVPTEVTPRRLQGRKVTN